MDEPSKPALLQHQFARRAAYPLFLIAAAFALLMGLEHLLRGLGYIWVGDRQTRQRSDPRLGIPETSEVRKGFSWLFPPSRHTRNSFGLRAPEPEMQRCPIPVLFLGDSYTYGAYVSDGQAYPALLQGHINPPDVCFYNAGKHGHHIEKVRGLLALLLANGLQPPRIVVHELLWNNLYDYDDPRMQEATDQYARFAEKKIWFPAIRFSFLRLHFHLAWKSPWVRAHLPPVGFRPSYVDDDLHQKMEAHLTQRWKAFHQEFADHQIAFVSVLIPYYRSMVLDDAPEFASLIAAHKERGVPYVLLTRELLPDDPFLSNDFHFNPQANLRLAELVEPLLEREIERVRKASPLPPKVAPPSPD